MHLRKDNEIPHAPALLIRNSIGWIGIIPIGGAYMSIEIEDARNHAPVNMLVNTVRIA